MLPFLKNRDDGVGLGPVPESIERKPDDEGDGFDMLDAVAEDLLQAIEKKDVTLLKEVLAAFADHIQTLDTAQDEKTMGETK